MPDGTSPASVIAEPRKYDLLTVVETMRVMCQLQRDMLDRRRRSRWPWVRMRERRERLEAYARLEAELTVMRDCLARGLGAAHWRTSLPDRKT